MMFLPALTVNEVMQKVVRSISRLGLTVRGVYGEGSDAVGYMYQISNEVTLGVSEEEILSQVEEVVEKVCELEQTERRELMRGSSALEVQDECLRAYGILTNCAKISTREFVNLAAKVKLGACLGYINISDVSKIDGMTIKLSPSNITAAAGKPLTPLERDVYRAQYCAKAFRKMKE